MLARWLGVPAADDVVTVCESFYDDARSADHHARPMLACVVGFYPWEADVARDVMRRSRDGVIEHLPAALIQQPGRVLIARDSSLSGADSLWVVVANPDSAFRDHMLNGKCAGIFRTFNVAGVVFQVVAVRLVYSI
jgi:hypothetical protein